MNESSRPAIGVVEAPDLAHALTLLGFFVVGGGDFRASALAIRSNPEAEKAPVVVFDATKPGLRAWVDKQIQTGSRVVVLRGAGSGSIPQDSGVNIQLPVAVNDVLAQAGWGPSPHPLGQATVTADGLVPDLALYAEAERAVEPEPESVVEPEPAAAQPVFIEPTAVQLQFDVPKTQAVSAPLPDWTQEGFGSTTVEPTPDAPAVNAAVPDWVNGEFTPSAPSRVQPVFNEPQPPAQAFLPPIAAESDEPKYAPLPDWMTGALPPAAETERPVSVPAPEKSSPVAPSTRSWCRHLRMTWTSTLWSPGRPARASRISRSSRQRKRHGSIAHRPPTSRQLHSSRTTVRFRPHTSRRSSRNSRLRTSSRRKSSPHTSSRTSIRFRPHTSRQPSSRRPTTRSLSSLSRSHRSSRTTPSVTSSVSSRQLRLSRSRLRLRRM